MSELLDDILDGIGNTSLLALRNITPENGSRILLKMEGENPTGSMKDRMALAMIEAAEADGRLQADGSVVEYTGGSTGVSLSLVCAVKGYPLHIVTSDAFAQEKLDHMEILGARLEVLPSESGRVTEKLTRDMVAAEAVPEGSGIWRFLVTVAHGDTGWQHYADKWDVVAPGGTVLGTRVLLHPHEAEQPFTRSLGGVKIPAGLSASIPTWCSLEWAQCCRFSNSTSSVGAGAKSNRSLYAYAARTTARLLGTAFRRSIDPMPFKRTNPRATPRTQ